MKKLVLILIIGFLGIHYADAQELGLRFGYVNGGNVAIDGMFSSSKASRIHADLSFGNGVGVDVLWDFVNKPLGGEAFYWYAGAGLFTQIDDPFWLGVTGEIGLEYRFNTAPIVLGLDYRPYIPVIEETDFWGDAFGFNVRYVFGK